MPAVSFPSKVYRQSELFELCACGKLRQVSMRGRWTPRWFVFGSFFQRLAVVAYFSDGQQNTPVTSNTQLSQKREVTVEGRLGAWRQLNIIHSFGRLGHSAKEQCVWTPYIRRRNEQGRATAKWQRNYCLLQMDGPAIAHSLYVRTICMYAMPYATLANVHQVAKTAASWYCFGSACLGKA